MARLTRSGGVAPAAAIVLVLLVASAHAAFPTLIEAGARDSANPQTSMCVCVDEGVNTDACIAAVKSYCTGASPDGRVCTFFRGLINTGSKQMGQLAGGFLAKTCGVKVPLSASACACLEVGFAGAAAAAAAAARSGPCHRARFAGGWVGAHA